MTERADIERFRDGGQRYEAWFTVYPSTHEHAGQTVEVVTRPAFNRLRHSRTEAVDVLESIRKQAGAVCAEYEVCEHPACQASYAAWALADQYLKGQ